MQLAQIWILLLMVRQLVELVLATLDSLVMVKHALKSIRAIPILVAIMQVAPIWILPLLIILVLATLDIQAMV